MQSNYDKWRQKETKPEHFQQIRDIVTKPRQNYTHSSFEKEGEPTYLPTLRVPM